MKVAIVTYGHIDSILPLVKHLGEKIQVDLYISVYGDKFSESVGSFDLSNYPDGLISQNFANQLLGDKVCSYIDNKFRVFLLKYPDLKVKNTKNFNVSYEFAKYLNKEKYDIVHYNGLMLAAFVTTLFLKRKNVLWTIHDPYPHTGDESASTTALHRLIGFLNVNIILHNKFWMNDFIHDYSVNPKKIYYVKHGAMDVYCSFCDQRSHHVPQNKTLLFFGRISKYKGIEYLIHAAIKAKSRIPDLKIIIAGSGKYYFDITEYQNNELFEFRNRYIGNEELVELVQECDAVVCPYTDATQSGVILTAFALNKPVIATAVGGIPEVVISDVTGKLVPAKDEDALSDAIVDMLSNPEKKQVMSKNIEKQFGSGEFSWNAISDQVINIYKATLRA